MTQEEIIEAEECITHFREEHGFSQKRPQLQRNALSSQQVAQGPVNMYEHASLMFYEDSHQYEGADEAIDC